MPVVGLRVLKLSSSNLGLLFTSMGAGSVVGAVFIIPWLRARLSPDRLILSANLLLVLVYMLMAFVRQTEAFFVVAALAGVGWTMSASELWVASQRMMPSWARGRMNATVIMISQGAMVVGGVLWGLAGAMVGNELCPAWSSGSIPHEPAFGRPAFDQRWRKSRREDLGVLSIRVESKEMSTRELLAA